MGNSFAGKAIQVGARGRNIGQTPTNNALRAASRAVVHGADAAPTTALDSSATGHPCHHATLRRAQLNQWLTDRADGGGQPQSRDSSRHQDPRGQVNGVHPRKGGVRRGWHGQAAACPWCFLEHGQTSLPMPPKLGRMQVNTAVAWGLAHRPHLL